MCRLEFVGLWILCLLPVAVTPNLVTAQVTPDTGKACFAGRPLPECRTFWLIEVELFHRSFGSGSIQRVPTPGYHRPDLNNHASWEFGGMSNRSGHTAVGGTFLFGLGGSGVRFGLKGRYRRWVTEQGFVDVSAGPLHAATRSQYPQLRASGNGITGDIALGWRDWAAFSVRADAVRGGGRGASAVYVGGRLGSYPAIVATAGITAFVALIYAAYSGT
jgi:hypothetical protein